MLRINDWYLTTAKYVTSATYIHKNVLDREYTNDSKYVEFNITDLTDNERTEIYSKVSDVSPNTIGNTLELVGSFDDLTTGSRLTIGIDDGTFLCGFYIYKNKIETFLGDSVVVDNFDAENNKPKVCRYTVVSKNGKCYLLFNTVEVLSYTPTTESSNIRLFIGFETQAGKANLKVQYLKRTHGIYKYIDIKDIDFELQIDSKDTFDSDYVKTYTKSDFNTVNSTLRPFDPVSFVCGTLSGDGYKFDSLVQAATIHMPPKQPEALNYYARVRFVGKYESDYSNCYLINRVKPETITNTTEVTNIGELIAKRISYEDEGYLAVVPAKSELAIILPDINELYNEWTLELYNAGDYSIAVYDFVGNRLCAVHKKTITKFSYDSRNTRWLVEECDKQLSFIVPPDITNLVFDAVFNHHIPAFDEVYTKELNSGNVADFVRAQSREISEVFAHIIDQTSNISWKTATIDDLNKRWGNIFKLDKSLFKNSVEMRDTLQVLISQLPRETLKKAIEYVVFSITGAKPNITEYKDKYFNIIWDDETRKTIPIEEQYYLVNDDEPSIIGEPFVLYGDNDQSFSWQVDIFDPYGLNYNKSLIREILNLMKPAHTYVIPCFYDFDGIKIEEKYTYGYNNYNNISYNK